MSETEKTTRVIQTHELPVRVKLSKGQRGNVGWEVEIYGKDDDEVFRRVVRLNERLATQYSSVQTNPKSAVPTSSVSPDEPHTRMAQALKNIKVAGEKLTQGGG